MILDVPYQSQEPLEDSEEKRWCGIASLWMVMAYYLKDGAPSVVELLSNFGPEFEARGFLHQDLLKIAREHNLRGFRKSWWAKPGVKPLLEKFKVEGESQEDIDEWLEVNLSEGFYTLERYIKKDIPIILSVTPEFSPSKNTHLVVLVGIEGEDLIIHDPYKRGTNFKISKEEFKKYWLKQAIIIRQKSDNANQT